MHMFEDDPGLRDYAVVIEDTASRLPHVMFENETYIDMKLRKRTLRPFDVHDDSTANWWTWGETFVLDFGTKGKFRSRPFTTNFWLQSHSENVSKNSSGQWPDKVYTYLMKEDRLEEINSRLQKDFTIKSFPNHAQKMGFMYLYTGYNTWHGNVFVVGKDNDGNHVPFRMPHILQDPTATGMKRVRTGHRGKWKHIYGATVFYRPDGGPDAGYWLAGYVLKVDKSRGRNGEVYIANDFDNWQPMSRTKRWVPITDSQGNPNIYFAAQDFSKWPTTRLNFMRANVNWRIGKYYWHYGIGDNRKYTKSKWRKKSLHDLFMRLQFDFSRMNLDPDRCDYPHFPTLAM